MRILLLLDILGKSFVGATLALGYEMQAVQFKQALEGRRGEHHADETGIAITRPQLRVAIRILGQVFMRMPYCTITPRIYLTVIEGDVLQVLVLDHAQYNIEKRSLLVVLATFRMHSSSFRRKPRAGLTVCQFDVRGCIVTADPCTRVSDSCLWVRAVLFCAHVRSCRSST